MLVGLLTGLADSAAALGRQTAAAPPDLCISAAQEAASRTGVPFEVLWAISLTETGTKRDGRFDSWPWTVNMEGKGLWFDTRDEALTYAIRSQARGARSFDIGCFQLNHRWHGEAFTSVDEMFDPLKSALYAARFLSDLYRETGSWEKAAGLYHSRTPEHANRYAALFEKHLATARKRIAAGLAPSDQTVLAAITPDAHPPAEGRLATADRPRPQRSNDYPLLQRGHRGQLGSLVPLTLLTQPARRQQDSSDASL